MRHTIALHALALGGSACGGDENACKPAGEKMCELGCACPSPDGECQIDLVRFENEADCRDFFVGLRCAGGGRDDIDHAACLSALDTATCSEFGMALALPEECKPPPE